MFGRVAALITGRSPKWPAVRRAWLKGHPGCEVCGAVGGNDVHHVEPFHARRDLELDPANLMTLCRAHHLLAGHLMDWKASNPTAREDAAAWLAKVKARTYPKAVTRARLMAEPTPDPVPTPPAPKLSGWQYVVIEVVKMLVPVGLAVIAIWNSNKADDRAAAAQRTADRNHAATAAALAEIQARPPVVKWGE